MFLSSLLQADPTINMIELHDTQFDKVVKASFETLS